MDKSNPNGNLPASLRKSIEFSDNIRKSVAPIVEQQEK